MRAPWFVFRGQEEAVVLYPVMDTVGVVVLVGMSVGFWLLCQMSKGL